jgi:hypothetical protein
VLYSSHFDSFFRRLATTTRRLVGIIQAFKISTE